MRKLGALVALTILIISGWRYFNIWRDRPPPGYEVSTPEDTIRKTVLPPGFSLELVAAEPMIQEPTAIAWDANGKLFVAEMRDYMQNAEGKTSKEPKGTVAMLTDVDGDGRMDRRTVFLDKLREPRAILPLEPGKILVGDPPNVWLAADLDGDGVADTREIIYTKYGSKGSNPEHSPNGLIWSLDNFIYSAKFAKKFKYKNGALTEIMSGFRGQWGIDQDDVGHLYYTSSNFPWTGDQVSVDYANYKNRYGSIEIFGHPDSQQAARAYIPMKTFKGNFPDIWPAMPIPDNCFPSDTLREDGTLSKFSSAAGATVYRGSQYPKEFWGNYFVADPVARIIRRGVISLENGVRLMENPYEKDHSEFIRSTDPYFRPVYLNNGPDGAMYIVDMSRGIIQWKSPQAMQHVSQSYLLAEEKYKLAMVKQRGRIYRIKHTDFRDSPPPVKLGALSSPELVDALSNSNGWVRDTAQKLLVLRNDISIVPALKQSALHAVSGLARLHSLWTLSGIESSDISLLQAATHDVDHRVREGAARLLEPFLNKESTNATALKNLITLSTEGDDMVKQQAILSIGTLKTKSGAKALVSILSQSAPSAMLYNLVVAGSADNEDNVLRLILKSKQLEASSRQDPSIRLMVQGIVRSKKANLTDDNDRLFIKWLRDVVGEPKKGSQKLALLGYVEEMLKAFVYNTNKISSQIMKNGSIAVSDCLQCHAGAAPHFEQSKVLQGDSETLLKVVLFGLDDSVENPKAGAMPAMGPQGNEYISSVLSYLRSEAGLKDRALITPAEVEKVRKANADRKNPWTREELGIGNAPPSKSKKAN
jgi:glucose/arabinose dehydrogenase